MITYGPLGRYGRFANQLFQIASTIGIATKNGYAYAFPAWKNHDHLERFGSSEDIDLQKYFVIPLPTTNIQLPDFPISWGWHPNLHVPDGVSLSGHMQSEKYFKHCLPLIQHYFTMTDEPPQNEDVAIHIRLGDYDNHFHPRLGLEYYAPAIARFPKGTPFKVFSDDPVAAYDMLKGLGYMYVSKDRTYIEDFKLMKSCSHFITGNSSYSLMAAILGTAPGKQIICPANWFGAAWGSGYREMSKDVYPENAIIL
jgi:hypothetical protein